MYRYSRRLLECISISAASKLDHSLSKDRWEDIMTNAVYHYYCGVALPPTNNCDSDLTCS